MILEAYYDKKVFSPYSQWRRIDPTLLLQEEMAAQTTSMHLLSMWVSIFNFPFIKRNPNPKYKLRPLSKKRHFQPSQWWPSNYFPRLKYNKILVASYPSLGALSELCVAPYLFDYRRCVTYLWMNAYWLIPVQCNVSNLWILKQIHSNSMRCLAAW